VHEERIDARVRAVEHRLPPRLVRHADHFPAEPRDRPQLRLRRRFGRDDDRPHARLARGPGDALRHVPGARGEDAAGDRVRARRADGVERAAQLERADRLQALELQPELARRLGRVQPDERRLDHRVPDPLPRGPDVVQHRLGQRRHSFERFVSSVRTRHSSG
jgi:hypothetical protein